MKYFKKIALGLMVGVLAIGFSAFTNVNHAKFAGAYYSTANQTWTSAGAQAPNQTASNYNLIGTQTYSCASASIGCTYDLVGGKYVFNSEGQNSLN
jgi:hypothetical protein